MLVCPSGRCGASSNICGLKFVHKLKFYEEIWTKFLKTILVH